MAGFSVPVTPKRRCIFVFKSGTETLPNFPMLVDTSGVYVRPDGPPGHYLTGISPSAENDPDVDENDFEVDHALFNDIIWPALAERVPQFEAIKVSSSWAGHYAFNSIDHNIILGRHPTVKNYLMANGCSGHGLMHSPAVGRALSELIEHSKFVTIDLSRFSFERLKLGRFVLEKNVL
jgi:FAD-dependent oxidoreductase domain-containing protein 1